jgi:hypothetical protein
MFPRTANHVFLSFSLRSSSSCAPARRPSQALHVIALQPPGAALTFSATAMRPRPSVLCALFSLLPFVLLVEFSAGSRAVAPRLNNCQLESWEYKPSKLETLWRDNVKDWGEHDYCSHVEKFQQNITYWLETNARLMLTDRTHVHGNYQDDVFSAFVRTYVCSGGSHTRTSWIEPLAFCLRHPKAPCDKSVLEGRNYLLLESHVDAKLSVIGHGPPKAFLFDMGASTYAAGLGGPSQSFLIDAYKQRGISFDRILLWEATPHVPNDIYDKVPRSLHKSYQYINIPVSPEVGDPGNPLEIIKALTQPEDFVAVKLDIDTPSVENALIQQILGDREVYSRIDEFYFEQHVNFAPLVAWWQKTIDVDKTLATSYDLFVELRERGIRAHGWP